MHKTVLPLLSLRSKDDVSQFVLGCDGDLGASSLTGYRGELMLGQAG